MKTIALDTNFLLIPFSVKVDIYSELIRICDFKYELIVLDKTIEELDKIIAEQRGKHKDNAKMAKQLLKKKRVKTVRVDGDDVDSILVRQAKEDGWIIATQDKGLIERLKKNRSRYIVLRQKKYLIQL